MIAKVGLGTLGLSGKYLNLAPSNAWQIIESIQNVQFEIIDSATVYAEGGNSIDSLLSEACRQKNKSVYFKIGADNLEGHIDGLISEFDAARKCYGGMLKCILLHRTDIELVCKHKLFFQYIRENFPDILLGVSTYSEEVLDVYHSLNIDVVQAPLNLIDYYANEKIFRNAKKYGITTQARSCLASGLLSGRYVERDVVNFKDSIRGRYKINPTQVSIYNKRIKAVARIQDFYRYACDKYGLQISMSNFSYSVIANLEEVDHIIVGGTALQQIQDNLCLTKLPCELMKEIIEEHMNEWQANSL